MTDKKLTDAEIKRALEYCKDCSANLNVEIIDLITRQQAEIERLKTNLNVELDNFASEYDDKIKSEAVKQCLAKVKNYIKTHCNPYGKPDFDYDTSIKILNFIDNLAKEMVGENDDR